MNSRFDVVDLGEDISNLFERCYGLVIMSKDKSRGHQLSEVRKRLESECRVTRTAGIFLLVELVESLMSEKGISIRKNI